MTDGEKIRHQNKLEDEDLSSSSLLLISLCMKERERKREMLAPSEVSSSLLVLWNRNKWLVEVEGDTVGVNLIRRMFLWLDVMPHHLHCSPRPSLLSPSDSLGVCVSVHFYSNMWKWNGYKFLQHLCSQSTFRSESFTVLKQMSKKLAKKKTCYCVCPSVTRAASCDGPLVAECRHTRLCYSATGPNV